MHFEFSLEGYDVAAAVERMLGQEKLWWEALGLFVSHFRHWPESWLTAQAEPALERKAVHALRSAAANVGAVRLAAAAGLLEAALSAARVPSGREDLAVLRQSLAEVFASDWQGAAEAYAVLAGQMPERP